MQINKTLTASRGVLIGNSGKQFLNSIRYLRKEIAEW
jgi:hypothetical protein